MTGARDARNAVVLEDGWVDIRRRGSLAAQFGPRGLSVVFPPDVSPSMGLEYQCSPRESREFNFTHRREAPHPDSSQGVCRFEEVVS